MEEEIIIPEEETFDYNKLRYILDKDGYVCHASLGALIVCDLGECTEYSGEVPEGYETLVEWHDTQVSENKLNAWKIVNGNLVYDASRDYKLTLQYEQDAESNKHITQKELGITTSEQEKAYNDLFPSHSSAGGEIIIIDDSSNYVGNLPTDEVTIKRLGYGEDITGLIELEFIGSNFLPNTATSSSSNGIDYYVETDKKITISGTSTDKSTLNLAGTDTSLKKILTFKRKGLDKIDFPDDTLNYLISGLDENTNLEFYYYDGADRTLVGTYNNGLIAFDNDTPVTQIVLTIESGITIDTTIAPMISRVYTDDNIPYIEMRKNNDGQYVYSNELSFFTAEKYQTTIENMHFVITTPTEVSSLTTERGGFVIEVETMGAMFLSYNGGSSDYDYTGCKCSVDVMPYEEYKNNYTLIDLGDNTLTSDDTLKLRDNEIILIKNDYTTTDTSTGEETYHGEEIYLDDVIMPKTYEPTTQVYSHQQVSLSIVYKDPRNIDITKISLKGLIQIMDIENTYNFTEEDYNNAYEYLLGNIELTQEEFELYDINGDGRISGSDYAMMLKMRDGEIPSTIKGTLEINTTKSQRTLVLRDEEGKISTSIGLNGITTPSLSVGGVPVTNSLTYSENETIIGTWIDEKPLYRRVIVCGNLPNNTTKSVLTGFKKGEIFITKMYGVTTNGTTQYSIPYVHPTSIGKNISIYADVPSNNNIAICLRTGEDRSSHTATVIIEYTKSTD